jgi:DUF4097 and DUF4098 domain-containing protein YvlB
MMRTSWRFLPAAAVLCMTPAFADEWSKSFVVSGKPDLHVTTGDGAVHLRAWDRKVIEVKVTTIGWKIGSSDVKVSDHQSGDRVDLDIHTPSFSGLFSRHSVDVDIQVPRELRSEIRTGDGSISVDSVRGEIHLTTGDGSISADSVGGIFDARTGDGSVHARGRFDLLTLQTGDGSIDATVAAGSKMTASWSVRTGDGSVNLRLPADLAADLDVTTGDGGIHSDLPVTVSGSHRENALRGQLNGGGPLLSVRTGDGSVRIGRT